MSVPATRNLTILLTDIKGFTDKTSHRSRADIQRLLDEHRELVLPVLQGKGGRLVKTIGDAFLMTYESPTDAVLAGVAAQDALARRNEGVSDTDRIEIRIAINAGEVNLMEGDVFGEAVNITSRIEGVTEAGEVYFTEAVYLAMNKTEVPSSEIGLLQLKGIPERVRVYKVRRETPVGVGQLPDRRPLNERNFAPDAKARPAAEPALAPALAAPAAPSVAPSHWRRALALAIDGILCSILLGLFMGRERQRINIEKSRPSQSASAPAGAKAIHSEGNLKIKLDEEGLRVDTGQDRRRKTVYEDGRGYKITTEQDSPRKRRSRALFALLWTVYGTLFLRWFDATPGKTILKLKVVSADGSPLSKRQRVLRPICSVLSAYALFLGYFWALWEPQRRCWHDLIAGTRVVPAE